MNQSKSDKIRLLLNELAILNQPEVIAGAFYFNADTLLKIKSLSAELYLNADHLLPGDKQSNPATGQLSENGGETPDDNFVPTLQEESIEDHAIQESLSAEVLVPEEIVIEDDLPGDTEQPESEIVTEPVLGESESNNAIQPEPSQNPNSDIFAGKISLTRRFEYINNLFSGSEVDFRRFLSQVSESASIQGALEIFDIEYDKRNWKRKAETADDLKSLIRKNKI